MKRDLISMLDVKDELNEILNLASDIKLRWEKGEDYKPLANMSLAMIFEKPSTRTRVSFEVGMTQLGGHALYLSPRDLQIGRGETIADTALTLSRYVDAIMYRAFSHELMKELARNATVPVINGLDDLEHPCQILADLLTIKEQRGGFEGLKLAYVGDGNNVCNSLMLGSTIAGMDMNVGCPEGYLPNQNIFEKASKIAQENNIHLHLVSNPNEAVRDADIIYTDVWVSMGDEKEKEKREKIFRPYQVNSNLVKHAKPDCVVLHCLPAHRGQEITDDVINGEHSIVFDQAENRLHAQKALMVRLLEKG
ncbi:MAG: ornithine carbamoyltransferase [Methanomassiliicoccales archaeon]|nr:MAG: ornithine carbamoyltransferase [Methanomassiliicoccales archaeon]